MPIIPTAPLFADVLAAARAMRHDAILFADEDGITIDRDRGTVVVFEGPNGRAMISDETRKESPFYVPSLAAYLG